MEKKSVTFRVFEIKSAKLTVSAESLSQILSDKIAGTNIEKRLISIKETDDSIKDLLGSHTINNADYFYGVMMRLKPAKEVKTLPDDFQALTELNESELQEVKEIIGKTVCSTLYHFMIKGEYLITDLPGNHDISSFQNYISKFLINDTFTFIPYVMRDDVKLRDIKTVTFKDSLLKDKEKHNEENNNRFSLKTIVKDGLQKICGSKPNLDGIIEDELVSARMTIKFERPKYMTVDDYASKLGILLAPINELQNVVFTLNNGSKLIGSKIVFNHKEILEGSEITAQTYISSMKRVLSTLES